MTESITKFNSAVFALNLPVDSSYSQQCQNQPAEDEIIFPDSLSQSLDLFYNLLEPFCSREESLLTIFLAIYSIILSRYTGQTDIVIGTLPIYDCQTQEQAMSSCSNSIGFELALIP